MIAAVDISSLAFIPKPALDAPKKQTIIRLRWMIVIASCYLLLFSRDALLGRGFVHGFTLFYLVAMHPFSLLIRDDLSHLAFFQLWLFLTLLR